jgi:ABC-2 type transport system permease protein
MLRAIAGFELRYQVRSPLFAILFLILFAFTFAMITGDPADGFGASQTVKWNSPYVVTMCLLMMSLFGTLTTTAFVVNAAHRDFELNTDSLFFSRPVAKWQYLGGRFLGSFGAGLLIFAGVSIATLLGSFMPWVPKEHLGPVTLSPYLYAIAVMVIPNLLVAGALFFAIAALTRSQMATYASVLGTVALYVVANVLAEDTETHRLAGMLDPFGVRAVMVAMRYWTPYQKNTDLLPLEGVFLWNRLLWVGVALACLAIAYARFNFTTGKGRGARRTRPETAAPRVAVELPRVRQVFSSAAQFAAIVRLEVIATFKSIPFLVMLICGVALVAGNNIDSGWLGASYPVTREMVSLIREAFSVFALLIAAFYAGDIVWRERTLKLSEVTDALPVPTWLQWSAKLTSLVLVVLSTAVIAMLTTIALQILEGWYHFEFALYAKGILGLFGTRLVLIAGLAFLMQIFFNHKLAGLIGVTVYFVLNLFLPTMGLSRLYYRFAAAPPNAYSDMNGYGHFVAPLLWTTLYWLLFVAMMLAAGHLFWVRGTETGLRQRLRIAHSRLAKPVAAALVALFAGFGATGCWIYYNAEVVNPYRSVDEYEMRAAEAEKKYKRYQYSPKPRITAVKASVDLHPERRAAFIDGSYVTVNHSGAPIREILVNWNWRKLTSIDVAIPNARLAVDDPAHGYRMYALAEPLPPGASLTIRFRTAYEARGFVGGSSNTNVVANGTFISNRDYFPHLGYNQRDELEEDREKHGLPPLERQRPPDDPRGRAENTFAGGSDWLSLDTTVSTSADQIAVAPGYLQREWISNGRRYFHYKTTTPIKGSWSYLSARYAVKRDRWRDRLGRSSNDVNIEIYYHPQHHYNVDRMIFAIKKSLDYYSTNVGSYQHKQVRILEFPGYATFAQAFPNTIPYSETLGFVADLRGDALDYVFYATAHEVAHQWWGHQVVPANVQGATMVAESLAQYSALMVLDREFDRATMRRYLRWELDRYLAGRGKETIREMPLALVERQDYVHYNKGALAMYALREEIGEERVNRALAKFLKDHAFSGPPYAAAVDIVKYLRAEAPPEAQELITDLFERITVYDNQTREATVSKRADGKYVVKLTVSSQKLRSDGAGEPQPVPNTEGVRIAVLGEGGKELFSEKRRITRAVETFEIVVGAKPVRAGIDPFYELIDPHPDDNSVSL